MFKKKKDKEFEEKYNKYSKMLYQIAYLHTGSSEDAEDILQETFSKLLFKPPKFTDDEHEKAWLIRVTINKCYDINRSKNKCTTISIYDIEIQDTDLLDENLDEIIDYIINMPDIYKAPIYLFYYKQMPVKEIADTLNLSQSAVKKRLQRGRQILKIELEEDLYEQEDIK